MTDLVKSNIVGKDLCMYTKNTQSEMERYLEEPGTPVARLVGRVAIPTVRPGFGTIKN